MRSKSQGLMANLLMFLPLLAVPFVAGFGVPWLAAKAKDEGLPAPELLGSSPLGTGVGQSDSARHSAEDLFAPLVEEAAVDLKLAPGSSPAAVQNPHLRNVSLVVSRNEPWVDPFEDLNASASPARSPAEQADNPANTSPEEALADWTIRNEPEGFEPPEAPMPSDFPAAPVEEEPPASNNPFATLETTSPASVNEASSQVAVEENAFQDPITRPRVNRDPNSFDASRTLFLNGETPSAPERTVEREPPATPPAKAKANLANTTQEPPQPLTWETARARLNEFGIRDFYLQPDPAGQVFLFRCAYTPPNNPRINRLFEAEDPDPLQAVRKVLAQLETWTNRQSASAN